MKTVSEFDFGIINLLLNDDQIQATFSLSFFIFGSVLLSTLVYGGGGWGWFWEKGVPFARTENFSLIYHYPAHAELPVM